MKRKPTLTASRERAAPQSGTAAGTTLVEVLIALAMISIIALPCLVVFQTTLSGTARLDAQAAALVAAHTTTADTAASLRAGETSPELRVTTQNGTAATPVHTATRIFRADDFLAVESAATLSDASSFSIRLGIFPPLQEPDKESDNATE